MADKTSEIVVSKQDLRAVAGFAADCAQDVLDIVERAHPGDSRPRDAVEAARAFAGGGDRGKALRDLDEALRSAGNRRA